LMDEAELRRQLERDRKVLAGGAPASDAAGASGNEKELLKVKKKLREIEQIKERISKGDAVQELQRAKVSKEAEYLKEKADLEKAIRGVAAPAPAVEEAPKPAKGKGKGKGDEPPAPKAGPTFKIVDGKLVKVEA